MRLYPGRGSASRALLQLPGIAMQTSSPRPPHCSCCCQGSIHRGAAVSPGSIHCSNTGYNEAEIQVNC
ncbi:hypothetical protein GDO81_010256 [Engystomops pustulosus]|uniref:Uncharacterized protein n=1 Tax=Engystomops pustulosus TaxID=76066 RepID=A0AAV7BZ72_ENGPU|nr:hypothetical protein GDO81_010256 [Engystomops pustulosus]